LWTHFRISRRAPRRRCLLPMPMKQAPTAFRHPYPQPKVSPLAASWIQPLASALFRYLRSLYTPTYHLPGTLANAALHRTTSPSSEVIQHLVSPGRTPQLVRVPARCPSRAKPCPIPRSVLDMFLPTSVIRVTLAYLQVPTSRLAKTSEPSSPFCEFERYVMLGLSVPSPYSLSFRSAFRPGYLCSAAQYSYLSSYRDA